jgi:hypothetical protein
MLHTVFVGQLTISLPPEPFPLKQFSDIKLAIMLPCHDGCIPHLRCNDLICQSLALGIVYYPGIGTCSIRYNDVFIVWLCSDFVSVKVLSISEDGADGVGVAVVTSVCPILAIVLADIGDNTLAVLGVTNDVSVVVGHDCMFVGHRKFSVKSDKSFCCESRNPQTPHKAA